jgi:hypothetical protein
MGRARDSFRKTTFDSVFELNGSGSELPQTKLVPVARALRFFLGAPSASRVRWEPRPLPVVHVRPKSKRMLPYSPQFKRLQG